jgi:porin
MFGGAASAQAQTQTNPDAIPLMQRVGQSLYDHGIIISSRYLGEFAANPTGGQKQGSDFAGELNLNTGFDLHKILGVPGAFIHTQFVWRQGQNLTGQQINNSVQVQQIYGAGKTWQLAILVYQQKLFGDKVDAYVGRTDIANDFIISPLYCFFQSNNVCGHPSNYQKDTQISSNPAAVWGGRILYAPTKHIYFKTGAYQTDPALNPYANHGFDFSTETANGYSLPFEVGYVGDSAGRLVPDHYDVGVILNHSAFSAAYYNPSSPNQYGRTLVYAEAQQRAFQQEAGSPRGIYTFEAGLFGASGQKQQSDYQLVLGAIWQGPLASRPADNIGLMATDTHYNGDYLNSLFEKRVAEGGTAHPQSHLDIAELNYTLTVNNWINFTPNLQYIVHPDGLGNAKYPTGNLPNAFVVGLQFNFNLNAFAGFPSAKPSEAARQEKFLEFSRAE